MNPTDICDYIEASSQAIREAGDQLSKFAEAQRDAETLAPQVAARLVELKIVRTDERVKAAAACMSHGETLRLFSRLLDRYADVEKQASAGPRALGQPAPKTASAASRSDEPPAWAALRRALEQ